MRIHFINHAPFETPGAINDWIENSNFSATATNVYAGEVLPALTTFELLIIMGGPQSPLELQQFPFLEKEIQFTKDAIAENKKILGICLGAQIIGEALGARTENSPQREIGSFPISLTPAASHNKIFKNFPQNFDVLHWHNDMPGLTEEAEVIAHSDGCPRQIVCYRENVYGFQCHLEMTFASLEEMIKHCSQDLSPDKYVQTPQEMLSLNFSAMHAKLFQFLNNFIAI